MMDTILFLLLLVAASATTSSDGARGTLSQLIADNEAEQRDLIVGGKESSPGEFPYYVHLLTCGGSLISPRVVMTAAHCGEFHNSKAYVGCHEYGTASGDAVERTVVDQVIHPDYDSDVFTNDYNLLLLDESVTLQDHTDIVLTLNEDDLVPAEGQEVTVLGLGLLEESGDSPDKVRFVEVQRTADDFCNKAYDGDIEDSVQFCAGVEGGGKDACQGDSGGPLVIRRGQEHLQVGVVSSGTGCASPDHPGIYARVSGQMDWIKSVVCNDWNQTDATFCPNVRTARSSAKPRAEPSEWFRIQSKDRVAGESPYCLALENGFVTTNGESIVMLPCDGTFQQQWTQFDNDYLIRSKMNPNKCVSWNEEEEGLELYDCFNDEHSTAFEAYSDGTIRMVDDSSKCWEYSMEESKTRVADCSSETSQQWTTTLRRDDLVRTKTAVKEALETKHAGHKKDTRESFNDSYEARVEEEDESRGNPGNKRNERYESRGKSGKRDEGKPRGNPGKRDEGHSNGWDTRESFAGSYESRHDHDESRGKPDMRNEGNYNDWDARDSFSVSYSTRDKEDESRGKSGKRDEGHHTEWEVRDYEPRHDHDESRGQPGKRDEGDETKIQRGQEDSTLGLETKHAGHKDIRGTHVPHQPRDEEETWFCLRNIKTDTCLALKDTAALTLIVLEPCDDASEAQRWGLTEDGELESKLDRTKCVVTSGDASLGSAMLVYPCSESNEFGEWEIPGFDDEENPIGPIMSKEDSAKCLASHALDSVVTLGHCPEDEDHIRNDRLWECYNPRVEEDDSRGRASNRDEGKYNDWDARDSFTDSSYEPRDEEDGWDARDSFIDSYDQTGEVEVSQRSADERDEEYYTGWDSRDSFIEPHATTGILHERADGLDGKMDVDDFTVDSTLITVLRWVAGTFIVVIVLMCCCCYCL